MGVTIARCVGWLSIGHRSHLQSAYHCVLLMLACHPPVFHGNSRIDSVAPHSLLTFAGPFGLVCGHDNGHMVGIRAGLSTSTESFEGVRTGVVGSVVFLAWHHFLLLGGSSVGCLPSLPAVDKKVINDTSFLRVSTPTYRDSFSIFISSSLLVPFVGSASLVTSVHSHVVAVRSH